MSMNNHLRVVTVLQRNLALYQSRIYIYYIIILHNTSIYHVVLVNLIWLALCSQVTRKF